MSFAELSIQQPDYESEEGDSDSTMQSSSSSPSNSSRSSRSSDSDSDYSSESDSNSPQPSNTNTSERIIAPKISLVLPPRSPVTGGSGTGTKVPTLGSALSLNKPSIPKLGGGIGGGVKLGIGSLNLANVARNSEADPISTHTRSSSTSNISPRVELSWRALETNYNRQNKTPEQIKQAKLLYFEKRCTEITDYFFLGNDVIARNQEELSKRNITHIINAAGTYCGCHHPQYFNYRVYHLYDGKTQPLVPFLWETVDFVERARKSGGRVYVHCEKGVSRSNAIVISYMMWRERTLLGNGEREFCYSALESRVKEKRATCSPNTGFIAQLLKWQKLLATTSGLRIYRICVFTKDATAYASNDKNTSTVTTTTTTSTSSYSSLTTTSSSLTGTVFEKYEILPECLVRDETNMEFLPVSVGYFDPRTCFILQNYDNGRVYIWVGSQARPEYVSQSERFFEQLSNYNNAREMCVLQQGHESEEFLSMFGSGLTPESFNADIKERTTLYPDLKLLGC